ncbi:MAG: MBL fold metallo-hydrolase [Cytophagales bacterium]|nr:MAG: MBL fold metallo-hydrolase [Cytophagales bacterium]
MNIQVFTFNALQENTYLLWDETKACIIIDAGCYDKEEQMELTSFIESNQLKPKLLLNTHSHIDHVLGNYFLKSKYNIPLKIYKGDESTLMAVKTYAPMYGMPLYQEQLPDGYIAAGESICEGNIVLEILFVPGHAPGHIAFYHKASNSCIVGDVLFAGSVGRADLPGGNMGQLITSIKEVLYPLGDDTIIFPGHGPKTIIGREKNFNPFLRD